MGINMEQASSQASQISQYASVLRDIQRSMDSFRGNLNHVWQAEEMNYVNNAITSMMQQIASCSSSLDALSSDISSTAWEIKREEEAREAAERARARQLMEQLERAKSSMNNLFK
ncbi:putative nucleic acid-binding Zn-ribbon protein [Paenibacillus sp. V4I9]|uniref:hypothetical protein n=1 Tax=Paenibacillus sp. V4I9 TaxID=3042308 RepID=UPI00278B7A9C|nr:hypothetical protein [Paenibacillus sp. V4I9]MDQ0885068.1 putative nucleic acid-binding Zn-ribbon protein [Paenibacillus sp. V4I9]